jgi:hypothetical protein
MGPVPVVEEPEPWTRDTPAKFANASARLREDDGHSKVKVSCGLVPTNALVLIESINSEMIGNRGEVFPRLMAAMKT